MPERVNEIQLLMCIVYYDPLNLINGKDFCANIIFSHFIYLVLKSLPRGSVLISFRDSGRERGD